MLLLKKLIANSLNSARFLFVFRRFTGGDEALLPAARAVEAPATRSDSIYCRPAFRCSCRRSFVLLMMAS